MNAASNLGTTNRNAIGVAVEFLFAPLRFGCAPGTKLSSGPIYKALSSWFSRSGRGLVPTARVHNARSGLSWGGKMAAAAAVCSVAAALLFGCVPAFGHQHLESWYADALAAEAGARTEVRMRDGTRCDVLTASHAVEVEFAAKWCEAVGQSLNYASQTGRAGAIAIILEREGDARFLQRLRTLIAFHRLPLAVVVMRPFGMAGLQFENLNAVDGKDCAAGSRTKHAGSVRSLPDFRTPNPDVVPLASGKDAGCPTRKMRALPL